LRAQTAGLENEITNNDDALYTVRGYLQSNQTTNSLVQQAYENWGYVNITIENAPLYKEFFDDFLPSMSILIDGGHNSDVFLTYELYTKIHQIVGEHKGIKDPKFVKMKNEFLSVVEELNGYTYQQVRWWMQGAL